MALPALLERRQRAQQFIRNVNSGTVCAQCGKQPIEWHNEAHKIKPYFRVSTLGIAGRSIERIQQEMDASIPLCRSCHMNEDGRNAELRASCPHKKDVRQPPKPCKACGTLTRPSWKGMCRGCYDYERRSR